MPRAIWKGHISFGLVNIPIQLYSAEQRSDMQFHLIDNRNQSRVRYERVNEVTGEEVPWNEIVKGYEYSDGNYVLLSDEDFKRADVEATQTVEIEDFIDAADLDWIYIDKPYFLTPGKKGEKGFVLLREALKRTKKVAIARVVIRSREHLAAVVARGDGLVLLLLRFHQELRDYGEYDLPSGTLKDYKITDKEMKMAEQLIASMESKWKPEAYHDEYREALMAWIEKKAKSDGAQPLASDEETPEEEPAIFNIMELLEQSVKTKKKKTTRKKARKHAKSASRKRA